MILFRADGGPGIGSGHLMRCLALAQALRDRGEAVGLATVSPDLPAVNEWRGEGAAIIPVGAPRGSRKDGEIALASARHLKARAMVADGYAFDPGYIATLKTSGLPLMQYDDLGLTATVADWVVNQNPGAETCSYPAGTTVLRGLRYLALRRALRALTKRARPVGVIPRLLVTFGGDDEDNLALAAMKALRDLPVPFVADVIVTAGPAGLATVRDAAAAVRDRFRVSGPTDIVPLMATADLGLCAGGSTSLELCALGVPMVIVSTADNQIGAAFLEKVGVARFAGNGKATMARAIATVGELLADPEQCRTMGSQGRALIDGCGVDRLARLLLEGCEE
ncbi:MAG: UDP-2,4-diacetamido-2,4,6-trideoxy-beta-L-altropyranose hydrolase [Magnetospirillum sp. WYHS-4]